MSVLNDIVALRERVAKEIIGQNEIIDRLLMGLLCNGNILVEGMPGLAKTRAIKALSKNIEGSFKRIQFTPDLVSTDITGKEIYYDSETGGQGTFKFIPGSIFANIVLADEINRAPAKTQNSLLEAMEERQVTVAGVSHKMADLFLVMATQNPVEQEGTFPLPEAQKDRFLMHVSVGYPDEASELEVVRLIRKEETQEQKAKKKAIEKAGGIDPDQIKTSQETIFAARAEIDKIHVPPHIEKYMVDLIFATRYPQRYTMELRTFILVGSSPRATIALDRTSRCLAWLKGRDTVDISDVHAMIKSCLRHRMIRGDRAVDHRITTDDIVEEILELVPMPETVV